MAAVRDQTHDSMLSVMYRDINVTLRQKVLMWCFTQRDRGCHGVDNVSFSKRRRCDAALPRRKSPYHVFFTTDNNKAPLVSQKKKSRARAVPEHGSHITYLK